MCNSESLAVFRYLNRESDVQAVCVKVGLGSDRRRKVEGGFLESDVRVVVGTR